jgi:hypothetical protein
MRFEQQYDKHKVFRWSQFYLEYVELKSYLRKARKVLINRSKYYNLESRN